MYFGGCVELSECWPWKIAFMVIDGNLIPVYLWRSKSGSKMSHEEIDPLKFDRPRLELRSFSLVFWSKSKNVRFLYKRGVTSLIHFFCNSYFHLRHELLQKPVISGKTSSPISFADCLQQKVMKNTFWFQRSSHTHLERWIDCGSLNYWECDLAEYSGDINGKYGIKSSKRGYRIVWVPSE